MKIYKHKKNFWRFIKAKRQDDAGISPLTHNGTTVSDSKGKATILNTQFKSVFTTEQLTDLPSMAESPYPEVQHIRISEEGVLKQLKQINITKATGPDLIPARILKEMADEIAPLLTCIFQQSLDTGEVPHDWRIANIAPIYKKGDRSVAANYRPVSLTSISCKILEHIIFSQVMDHYDSHNILIDSQHGFRSGRSCESQLIITAHDFAKTLDDRMQLDSIILDFSKAFDRVPHHRLLLKLHHYGIRGSLLTWFDNFLTKRSQRVVVDGEASEWTDVLSGVPQGTVLGPLLFLTFINDISESISSSIRLFADDCLMYRPINTLEDCKALQEDLDKLHNWTTKWQMKFNSDKCHVMQVSHRLNNISYNYHLGEDTLTSVNDHPYLGLTFTSKLSWKTHINNVTLKANRMLGLIKRNLKHCHPQLKEQAYISLVRPHLEYCSTVWNPYHQTTINQVEAIQKRAARFVRNVYQRTESVTSLLKDLNWPSLKDRRENSIKIMMYKISNDLIAINKDIYLQPMTQTRLRNHHPAKYQPLSTHSSKDVYKYSFMPTAVRLWNSLPADIITSPSLDVFRAHISAC